MFDITTSRDYYAKLVEDFDDYMAEPHSARLADNCAITAFHLYEWVWCDWLESDAAVKKALRIENKKSFLDWIDKEWPWFPVVHDLANGTKHFKRSRHKELPFDTMRVKAAPFALDQLTAGLDEGALDGPILYPQGVESHGKGCLLIDYGEGAGEHRWQPAAHLLEGVVRFWRDFFKKYRPALDLPVSKHHAV